MCKRQEQNIFDKYFVCFKLKDKSFIRQTYILERFV